MSGSFKVKGGDEIVKNIQKFGQRGVKAATTGLEVFGSFVLSESQKEIPFDQGDLQKSVINQPVVAGVKVIGFGSPYAARQHEDTSLRHPGPHSKNPARGAKGKAKFLEDPLKKHMRKMLLFIGFELDKIK